MEIFIIILVSHVLQRRGAYLPDLQSESRLDNQVEEDLRHLCQRSTS